MKFLKLLMLLIAMIITFCWLITSYSTDSTPVVVIEGILVISGFAVLSELKKAAFGLGKSATATMIESKRASRDSRDGTSEKEYERLLANAAFTKDEAHRMLASIPKGFDTAVRNLNANTAKPLTIPTFFYEQGMPGEHMLRATVKDINTVARIVGPYIVFYESKSLKNSARDISNQEVGRILASSVRSIGVVDLDETRRSRKLAAKATDKITSLVSGGALQMSVDLPKTTVNAAGIFIKYVNQDGVVLNAVFRVPSGAGANEATKTAMEKVFAFRSDVTKLDGWDKLLTNASFLEASPFLSLADTGLETLERIVAVINFLSDDDPAVPVAKASAEMLALFTQNEGFSLRFGKQSGGGLKSTVPLN